jgi:hypothetical protein
MESIILSCLEFPIEVVNRQAVAWETIGDGRTSARVGHTAIWTGTEMIIWGGGTNEFDPYQTGSRYNPATSTWIHARCTSPGPQRAGMDHFRGRIQFVQAGAAGHFPPELTGVIETGSRLKYSFVARKTGSPSRQIEPASNRFKPCLRQ